MDNYIITAEAIEQFNCKNKSVGISQKLAVYYVLGTERLMLYRESYPTPNIKGLNLLIFETEKEATILCEQLNKSVLKAIYKVEVKQHVP